MKTKIWLLLPVVGLLLAMTQHFPERGKKKVKEFLVTDFGALPDGKTLNTRLFRMPLMQPIREEMAVRLYLLPEII